MQEQNAKMKMTCAKQTKLNTIEEVEYNSACSEVGAVTQVEEE